MFVGMATCALSGSLGMWSDNYLPQEVMSHGCMCIIGSCHTGSGLHILGT